ncbi:amidase [Jatrophihabitans endophyticus]|uniref:amidase n=1 Tax=Jatrophihabitans endophyticus TaxID=1206085 RepID=UPI0019FC4A83|nr:amidase [Jatrophihabitans endophyticus]MBE7187978.1 amidase [Jatrophihabitans endophyticus]
MQPELHGLDAAADVPVRDVTRAPARHLAAAVASGEVSAEEVAVAHLRRIAELEPELHALVGVDGERAIDQARAVDERRRRGEPLGALAGVPFVVKDNIDVSGQTTACGSRAHDGVLALRDAPVVARLFAADAVLLGRANMDELAMGASTQTSAFGATRNPWDSRRSPGGSSGGSAAAVAAGLAAVSVGTDTGGSIREPASQCGVVGMAPSPGLVPVDGVVPFAPDLDRAGPLARTVADVELLLDVLTAAGPRRGGAAPPVPRRVGLIEQFAGARNASGVLVRLDAARACLESAGVEVVTVSVADAPAALTAYMQITSAACVPLMEPYVRTGQAGHEVVRRWTLGRQLLGPDAHLLAGARAVAARLTGQCRAALATCDVLLAPTMPTTAPLLTARTADADDMSLSEMADPLVAPYTDCWTVLANLAGLPAVSVPFGTSNDDGMPVGMMLSGAAGSDRLLLALAAQLESAAE